MIQSQNSASTAQALADAEALRSYQTSATAERSAMADPVAAFKSKVVQTPKGETLVYHVGHLAADSASSPTLTNVRIFANGLQLMGRVELRQKRVQNAKNTLTGAFERVSTEYSMRVIDPVRSNDFDTARKAHLESIK